MGIEVPARLADDQVPNVGPADLRALEQSLDIRGQVECASLRSHPLVENGGVHIADVGKGSVVVRQASVQAWHAARELLFEHESVVCAVRNRVFRSCRCSQLHVEQVKGPTLQLRLLSDGLRMHVLLEQVV